VKCRKNSSISENTERNILLPFTNTGSIRKTAVYQKTVRKIPAAVYGDSQRKKNRRHPPAERVGEKQTDRTRLFLV
jgi:hypothetical protein